MSLLATTVRPATPRRFNAIPIHCYAAKFGDDLARQILMRLAGKHQTVLDPFAGSGTTLVQAARLGMNAIGIDVDPIACLISRVQTRNYSQSWLSDFRDQQTRDVAHLKHALVQRQKFFKDLKRGQSFDVNGHKALLPKTDEIDFWFTRTQQIVLASLVAYMHAIDDIKAKEIVALAISASIIRKWPNTLSRAMDIDHSRPHRVRAKVRTPAKSIDLFNKVLMSTIGNLERKIGIAETIVGEIKNIQGDCVAMLGSLQSDSVDCVLTSPPYVNAIDYPRAHKFAEWWLYPNTRICQSHNYIGLRRSKSEFKQELRQIMERHSCYIASVAKSDRTMASQLTQYFDDISQVTTGCYRVLKSGAPMVIVLADNVCKGERVPVVNIVAEIMEQVGFKEVTVTLRSIRNTRRRYPLAFQGVMRKEAIIMGRKE